MTHEKQKAIELVERFKYKKFAISCVRGIIKKNTPSTKFWQKVINEINLL